jgi:hypothetical protein
MKASPDMSANDKITHLVRGLKPDLYREVMKSINIKPVKNTDELYALIKSHNDVNELITSSRRETQADSRELRGNFRERRYGRRYEYNNAVQGFGSNRRGMTRTFWNSNRRNVLNNRGETQEDLNKRFDRLEVKPKNENFMPRNKPIEFSRTVDNRPICFACKRRGHFARECPDKPIPFCEYCKRKGHVIALCYAKKNNEIRRKTFERKEDTTMEKNKTTAQQGNGIRRIRLMGKDSSN